MFSANPATCPWFKRPLVWVIFLGLILRLGSVALNYDEMRWQNDSRMSIPAARILEGKGLTLEDGAGPTAYRPPLYILWLVVMYAVFGTFALVGPSLVQALVSTLNIGLAYLLGREIWKREDAALAGALLLAIHPYTVWHDAALYHTFLSTAFLFGGLILLFKSRRESRLNLLVWSGICFGFCILITSVILPFLIILAIAALVACKMTVALRLKAIALFTAGLLLIWTPWIIRNAYAFNVFIPLTTDSGITMWQGNNPLAPDLLPQRRQEDAPPPPSVRLNRPADYGYCYSNPNACQSGVTEAEENKTLARASVGWITTHPLDFASLTSWRMMSIWSPFLTPAKSIFGHPVLDVLVKYGYPAWNVMIYSLVIIGSWIAWREGKRAEVLILLTLAITATGSYALFLFFTKYRIPFEAMLLPIAGGGLMWIVHRLQQKIKRSA